ncbi:hypothetical protein ACVBEQ_09290 [Nakamurella sp. GG22]
MSRLSTGAGAGCAATGVVVDVVGAAACGVRDFGARVLGAGVVAAESAVALVVGDVIFGDVVFGEVVFGDVGFGEVVPGVAGLDVVLDWAVIGDMDSPAAAVVEMSVAAGPAVAPEAPTGERVAPARKNSPVAISTTAAAIGSHREAGREVADAGCCLILRSSVSGAGGPPGTPRAREYPTARAGW